LPRRAELAALSVPLMAWLASWFRPPFVLRLCLVNTIADPDTAFRCVVWSSRGAWLVLRQVALVKATGAPTPLDGEVVIHRSNVAFIQVIS
jgi:hypothetical protein